MPVALPKPFIKSANYIYNNMSMSDVFFVVESDRQISAYLKSKSLEEFKEWFEGIQSESGNREHISYMISYEYFTGGMDKPYKNDITPKLLKAAANENDKYSENLYYLLTQYSPRSRQNLSKDTSLNSKVKDKFFTSQLVSGGIRKNRFTQKNRKNRKTRKTKGK